MNGTNEHYGNPPGASPATAAPAAAPAPAGAGAWNEYHSADGRVYYHNSATNVTQWTKPEDMMTPVERALLEQPWKQYTAEGGRKYWYNTETKKSSWEMPEAYKSALGLDSAPTTPATPVAIPTGPAAQARHGADAGYDGYQRDHQRDYQRDYQRDNIGGIPESRQLTFGNGNEPGGAAAPAFVPTNSDNLPEYPNAEEAEAAFVKLLRRSGVQPDWTWEQALRAIVRDPQYRAIRDAKERRAVFEKYCDDVITHDKERAKERLTKLRADFATMLKSHPEIKHYTHWRTARPMIEGETIFRSTNSETERRQLFDDYVDDLRRNHRENKIATRKGAMDGLIDLLPKLNLEPYTRWADARHVLEATPPFQNDEKYQSLSKFDVLTVFQNHMKALERTFNDSRQEEKTKKLRRERKNREGFAALLGDLRRDGRIKAGSKWSQIFPLLEHDDRYLAMAGQSGSTPQELFWDLVDEEQRALRGTRNDVEDVIDDKRFEVTPKTTFESFLAVMRDDRRTANIDREVLSLIFERLQEKKKEKRSDDDRQAERQQRRALDDFRAFLKRVDPPLTATDTYEKVKSRLLKSEEYQAVTSDDARQGAFDKYIRRLRDREEEAERDRDRQKQRRDRPDRLDERDRNRDSVRGDRSSRHGGGSRLGGRSRSPEADTYEADRRRAIAERERNYRKPSVSESLDKERDRDRDRDRDRERDRDRDRERDRDRRDRDRDRDLRDRDRERDRERDRDLDRERDRDRDRDRLRERERERDRDRDRERDHDRDRDRLRDVESHYDRERRDREEERERQYRRRLAERNPDELNYGDEKPPSVRRRRDEDDADRRDSRDSKRLRRDSPRERTPQTESQRGREPPSGSASVSASASASAPALADGPTASSTSKPAFKATTSATTKAAKTGKAAKSSSAAAASAQDGDDAAGMHSGSEEGEIEED